MTCFKLFNLVFLAVFHTDRYGLIQYRHSNVFIITSIIKHDGLLLAHTLSRCRCRGKTTRNTEFQVLNVLKLAIGSFPLDRIPIEGNQPLMAIMSYRKEI
jgi:hypothetical protein